MAAVRSWTGSPSAGKRRRPGWMGCEHGYHASARTPGGAADARPNEAAQTHVFGGRDRGDVVLISGRWLLAAFREHSCFPRWHRLVWNVTDANFRAAGVRSVEAVTPFDDRLRRCSSNFALNELLNNVQRTSDSYMPSMIPFDTNPNPCARPSK